MYLASASFSGSTLLSFVLNAHSRITSIGEMGPTGIKSKERYLCSCGSALAECDFFTAISHELERGGRHLDMEKGSLDNEVSKFWPLERLITGHLGSTLANRFRDRIVYNATPAGVILKRRLAVVETFISSALKVSGGDVFFDAHKKPSRIPFYLASNAIELKIIHLIRDPRGQISSSQSHLGNSLSQAARNWHYVNSMIESYLKEFDTRDYLTLRYEDFCENANSQYWNILNFIGVHSESLCNDFRLKPHHIVGNKMRLFPEMLRVMTPDNKWRDHLTAKDVNFITDIVGNMASRYGYKI